MNIWLIYPYEILPGEGGRPGRAIMIADNLISAGHQVTLWVSSFDHRIKKHRIKSYSSYETSGGVFINIIPTCGYKKNISIFRIFSEFVFGMRLLAMANKSTCPDIVIVSEPSTFYWNSVLTILKNSGASLVVDVMDLWPEMFGIALPRILRRFQHIIFSPLYEFRARKFKRANAIIAVSKSYAELSKVLAPQLSEDKIETVYYGVHISQFQKSMREGGRIPEQLDEACKDNQRVKIIFASSLGSNYDVKTILDCVPLLQKAELNFCLFIAGIGPLENLVKNRIRELSSKNIFYLGNPNSDELARIYSYCDIGISAYLPGSMVSLPIKAFHYSAAGLAIVNSLVGDFSHLLVESRSGIQYEAENSQSLARAIQWYCENPQVLIDAKNASYKLGLNFDADFQYSKVSNLLKLLKIDKK